jgi:hypothetical protein
VSNTNYSLPGQFIDLRILDRGEADTVTVTCVARKAHPVKSSSMLRYWSLSGNRPVAEYAMTLEYDDALLNGSEEDLLDAWVANDGRENWKMVSSPVNLERDTTANTLRVGTSSQPITEGLGDVIVSAETVAPQPAIGFAFIGRNTIRVGPPNRYTVTYWNRTDYPAGEAMMTLRATGGISFKEAIFYDSTTEERRVVPIDSMIVNDDRASFMVQTPPLGPREVRSFDVIALARPDAMAKSQKSAVASAIVLGVGYLAAGAVWNYYQNYGLEVASETCYQMFFASPDSAEYRVLFEKAIREVEARYAKRNTEVEVKEVASYIGKSMFEQATSIALWPVEVLSAGKNCFTRVLVDMFNRKHGKNCGITINKQSKRRASERVLEYREGEWSQTCYSRSLTKVSSWDPNDKQGPPGVGSGGYFARTDPMTYTIFFENKKEATAAAYRVEILDTLDASVFDLSSVEFGPTSHPRVEHSLEGSVLSWEFDSIELPPNANPPEGEGWVRFTVRLKDGLDELTEIRNSATITFDLNKPITTNTTLNTIDRTPPVTTIDEASYLESDKVALSFSVADTGAGHWNTAVYLSTDNEPFTRIALVDCLSTVIEVPAGTSHRFYCYSQDLVGNMESGPARIVTATPVLSEIAPAPLTTRLHTPGLVTGSAARLSFTLASRQRVRISLYDMSGRRLLNAVNAIFEAGSHSLALPLGEIGAKSCVVVMDAGGYSARHRMVMIR